MKLVEMDLWTQHGKVRVGQTEKVADIYTVLSVKQMVSGKLLNNTRSPAWHSLMTQRGGMAGGGEGGSGGKGYVYNYD